MRKMLIYNKDVSVIHCSRDGIHFTRMEFFEEKKNDSIVKPFEVDFWSFDYGGRLEQNKKYENKLQVIKQNCKLHNKITSMTTKLQVIKQNYKLHKKITSLKTPLQIIKQKYKLHHKITSLKTKLQVINKNTSFTTDPQFLRTGLPVAPN